MLAAAVVLRPPKSPLVGEKRNMGNRGKQRSRRRREVWEIKSGKDSGKLGNGEGRVKYSEKVMKREASGVNSSAPGL